MLFIDHDQPQIRHRCQHRHARAQHQPGHAGMRGQPAFEALRRRQAAVQRHHALAPQVRKTRFKTRLQLRRQVDLGHHHQHLGLGVFGQHTGGGAQVDLGLAAAGAAKQQGRARVCRQLVQRGALFGAERQSFMRCFGAGGVGLRALEPARQLHRRQLAQLGRQRGQGDFAQRALVVARRESHQTAPGGIERRYSLECTQHRTGLFRRQITAVLQRFPDHAQHLTAAQRYANQLARRQW